MGIQKSTVTVSLLEIGQSQPLPDPDFLQLSTGKEINFVTVAPLDAYTTDELLTQFKPAPDELPISSLTSSGQRILISRSALVPELQKGIRDAEKKGIAAVLVTCTGEFDLGQTTVRLILPGDLLQEEVQLHHSNLHKVAILVPVDEQRELLTERWVRRLPATVQTQAFTLSPQSSLEACCQMGEFLTDLGFDTTIMDCFGYSLAQDKAVGRYIPLTFNAKAVAMEFIKTRLSMGHLNKV